jgi:hypothetical protein
VGTLPSARGGTTLTRDLPGRFEALLRRSRQRSEAAGPEPLARDCGGGISLLLPDEADLLPASVVTISRSSETLRFPARLRRHHSQSSQERFPEPIGRRQLPVNTRVLVFPANLGPKDADDNISAGVDAIPDCLPVNFSNLNCERRGAIGEAVESPPQPSARVTANDANGYCSPAPREVLLPKAVPRPFT